MSSAASIFQLPAKRSAASVAMVKIATVNFKCQVCQSNSISKVHNLFLCASHKNFDSCFRSRDGPKLKRSLETSKCMAHLSQMALTQLRALPPARHPNRLPYGCKTMMTGTVVYVTMSESSSCAAALVVTAFILLAWGLIRFPAKISFVICAKAIRLNAEHASLFYPSRMPLNAHSQLAISTSIRNAWTLLKTA